MSKAQRARVRNIIIDANIAQSAGSSVDLVSVTCRQVLDEVTANRALVAAFSTELINEWRHHRSTYADRWLSAMFGSRRAKVHDCEIDEVADAIASAGLKEKERQAAMKDAHLVALALAVRGCIISRDKAALALFIRVALSYGHIGRVNWVNPCDAEHHAIDWIRAGAPDLKPRRLRTA